MKFEKVDLRGFQTYSSSVKIFPRIHFLRNQLPKAKLSIILSNGMDTYQDKLELCLR